MLLNTHLLDFVDIHFGAAVENRKLRSVDLYEAVVDAQGIESGKTVLNG